MTNQVQSVAFPGKKGDNGWTPRLAVVADGGRRVQQVADWFGGSGTKPATGAYVGATGYVTNIADAADVRGAPGITPTGAVVYMGTWDATSGAPPSNAPQAGQYWVVSVSGTTSLGGLNNWHQRDWAIYNGGAWGQVNNEDLDAQIAAINQELARQRTVTVLSSSGGVVAVDLALGNYFRLDLTENVTGFTFSNPYGANKGGTIVIQIKQDATPRTVNLSQFRGAASGNGSLSTTADAEHLLALTTLDNGATWDYTLSERA